jgi:hypothetical protein
MTVQEASKTRNPLVLSGVVFVLLWLGGSIWQSINSPGGAPFPRPNDAMDHVQAYFKAAGSTVGFNAGLEIVSAVALLVFAAVMSDYLKRTARAASSVVLAAGVASTVLLMASAGTMAILAGSDLSSEAAATQLLYQLAFWFGGPLHVATLGAMIAAVAFGLRGVLPKWLNGFGIVVGAAGALASFSALVPATVLFTPIGRFLGFAYLAVAATMVSLNASRS